MIKKVRFSILIAFAFAAGCSHMSTVVENDGKDTADPVLYTVTYIIHADDDYLYHNSNGIPIQANKKAFSDAIHAAQEAKSGEVFIFHQNAQRKFLGLFPRRSSEMIQYRNGVRINHVKYRPSGDDSTIFATEAELFNQTFSDRDTATRQNYLLYFGHEIPAEGGNGYHKSRRNISVNAETFTEGIQKFLPDNPWQFDLIVLSTCSNGTPVMAKHLHPYTKYLLASPQNLHLSYMDTETIGYLEKDPSISPKQIGREIAKQTFDRLSGSIQTTVTLALYDFNVVGQYIGDLYELNSDYEKSTEVNRFADTIDCNELAFFDDEQFRSGIDVYYQASRFGRESNSSSHSGWGCKAPL